MRNSFIIHFVVFLAVIFFTFILCFAEAYAIEEGIIISNASNAKHQIVGYITFIGKFLGNNFFKDSIIFSAIFLPFSIVIDALLLTIIFSALKTFAINMIKVLHSRGNV